jgi:hypothetical protein
VLPYCKCSSGVHGLWYEEFQSVIVVGCVESAVSKARDMREGEERQNEDIINDLEKQQI